MTRAVLLGSLLSLSALAAGKPKVAVLYFDVNGLQPELQVLKKGMAEMITTDLVGDPALEVLERSRLEDVLAELKLQSSNKLDPKTAQQVGKLLGAEYLVVGSMVAWGATTRVMARILIVEEGKSLTAANLKEDFTADNMFDAEQRLSTSLAAALAKAGARPPPPSPKKTGALKMEHAVKYSQALDALDKKDKKTAKEKLQEVVKAQPDFLLASLELDRLMK